VAQRGGGSDAGAGVVAGEQAGKDRLLGGGLRIVVPAIGRPDGAVEPLVEEAQPGGAGIVQRGGGGVGRVTPGLPLRVERRRRATPKPRSSNGRRAPPSRTIGAYPATKRQRISLFFPIGAMAAYRH